MIIKITIIINIAAVVVVVATDSATAIVTMHNYGQYSIHHQNIIRLK